MKLRGRARARAVPAAAVALLLLTGCGDLTPGTASVVNGTRITDDEVQALANAQCRLRDDLTEAGAAPVIPASRVQRESLSLLIDTELNQQYGKSEGLRAEELLARGFLDQVKPFFERLPEQAREELTAVFREWSEGQALLVQAGSQATGEEISLEKTEQLLIAGLQDREAWLKKAEIETNPRYAPNENGFPSGEDGSVSRATSDFATGAGGGTDEPDPEWVSGLPANQKCG